MEYATDREKTNTKTLLHFNLWLRNKPQPNTPKTQTKPLKRTGLHREATSLIAQENALVQKAAGNRCRRWQLLAAEQAAECRGAGEGRGGVTPAACPRHSTPRRQNGLRQFRKERAASTPPRPELFPCRAPPPIHSARPSPLCCGPLPAESDEALSGPGRRFAAV